MLKKILKKVEVKIMEKKKNEDYVDKIVPNSNG